MRSKFSKIALATFAVNSALSMAFAGIPANCTEEITTLSRSSGFDMQAFTTNLPVAVAKAKLQAKAPFGKPKDSDKTDIGITFGCLKAFPESPGEIQSLLKDISHKTASDAVATAQAQPQYVPPQEQPQYPPQGQHQYQQAQVSPYPPPQAQVSQYPPPQVQYQYPPPQVYYIYLPQQVQQTQCEQSKPEYFSTNERWMTWMINIIIPGFGSFLVMEDYAGMLMQWVFTASGIYTIAANDINPYIGIALLSTNFIFNIFRSYSYNEPPNNHASNNRNGFNLAVLPNRHGEVMPYLLYNKTF